MALSTRSASCVHVEGIAQRHAERGDRRDRVGEAFAGNVRRRAVHGFVKRLAPAGLLIGCAERGRRQHAERARHHRGFVGQNVAEQIVGDDDVELLRVADQLHCAVVGQDVLELDVRSVGLVRSPVTTSLPQHACAHDVVLLGRMDLVAALARQIEGDLGDALDFVRRVDLRIDGAAFAVFERHDFLRLAEIDAARQLAHDHDVEAFDQLALQARGVGERRIADGRAEVGEQVEVLAQPQQAGFGTRADREPYPTSARRRRRTSRHRPSAPSPWPRR